MNHDRSLHFVPRRDLVWLFCILAFLPTLTAHGVGWALALNHANVTPVAMNYNIVQGDHDGDYCRNNGSPGYLDWYGYNGYDYAKGMSSAAGTYSVAIWRSDTGANIACRSGFSVTDGVSIFVSMGGCTAVITEYRMNLTVTNDTTVARQYWIDYDGNGDTSADEFVNIAAGHSSTRLIANTNAAYAVTVTYDVENGDGTTSFGGTYTVTTDQWTETTIDDEDPTPTTTFTHQFIPRNADTTSQVSTNRRVAYATPSGGGVTESTYQTGTESLRNATIEGLEAVRRAIDRNGTNGLAGADGTMEGLTNVVDAVDRASTNITHSLYSHHTNLLDALGWNDRNSISNALPARASGALGGGLLSLSNSVVTFKSDVAEGLAGAFEPPTADSMPAGFWSLPLSEDITASWAPDSNVSTFIGFGRSLIVLTLWLAYASFCLWAGLKALMEPLPVPQASSSSAVPVASSGVAIAAAVIILGILAIAFGLLSTVCMSAVTDSRFATGVDWRSTSFSVPSGPFGGGGFSITAGAIFALADSFVPIGAALSLSLAAIIYRLNVQGIAFIAAVAIRLVAV